MFTVDCMKSRVAVLMNSDSVALILGDGASARWLALKLRVMDKLNCLICDTKKSRSAYILPTCAFLKLCKSTDEQILLVQLEDIAQYGDEQMIFLVAQNEDYARFVNDHRSRLESRYIITDREGIRALLKSK
jgi:hypothetical protein